MNSVESSLHDTVKYGLMPSCKWIAAINDMSIENCPSATQTQSRSSLEWSQSSRLGSRCHTAPGRPGIHSRAFATYKQQITSVLTKSYTLHSTMQLLLAMPNGAQFCFCQREFQEDAKYKPRTVYQPYNWLAHELGCKLQVEIFCHLHSQAAAEPSLVFQYAVLYPYTDTHGTRNAGNLL